MHRGAQALESCLRSAKLRSWNQNVHLMLRLPPRGSGSGIMLMNTKAQDLKSNRTSHTPRSSGPGIKSYISCTKGLRLWNHAREALSSGPEIKPYISCSELRLWNHAHEALSSGPEVKSYISCSEGLRPWNQTVHVMHRGAQALESCS
jgi:hypothetical protein